MTNKDVTKLKVAVLAGGWSDEREVSLASGREVLSALRDAGFSNLSFLDIAEDGFFDEISHGGYDVAFVALHGKYGEDGCIQGLLELLRIPFTFSGVLASATAMDKWVAKGVYRQSNIPTPHGVLATIDNADDELWLAHMEAELGLPIFVKPAGNGSSFGITKVHRIGELADAVRKACEADKRGKALVESAISGTEVTVPVIGNDQPTALPVIEIVTGSEFYDSTVKYEPSDLHHVIPARIPDGVADRAKELATKAHVALGCKGCSRSDFIIDGNGNPVILETNTIPGMTSASLLPDSARHAGISFPTLCRMFVEMAMEGTDAGAFHQASGEAFVDWEDAPAGQRSGNKGI